jgi:hypothetical protein
MTEILLDAYGANDWIRDGTGRKGHSWSSRAPPAPPKALLACGTCTPPAPARRILLQ